jgi:hypothetical protein
MDKHIIAVLLSFSLYALYVLLPLVPAILIYSIFPNTKVGISGPLGGLSMKAGGAFAAYVITVLLGSFLIIKTHEIIGGSVSHTWSVKATIELHDNEDNVITSEKANDLLANLEVQTDPELITVKHEMVKMELPAKEDTLPTIFLSIPKFGDQTIDLESFERLKIDHFDKTINLGRIMIKAYKGAETNYVHDPGEYEEEDTTGGPPPQEILTN